MKKPNGTVVSTVHSIRKKAVGILAVFLCIVAAKQNVQGQCTPTQIPIDVNRTITGTAGAVGTTYRFSNAIPGVDVVFKIDSLVNGAGVRRQDVAPGQTNPQQGTSNSTYSGYTAAWQPVITTRGIPAGAEGRVVWKIYFYATGTTTSYRLNCMSLLAIDIDGDNDVMKEFAQTRNPYSFAGSSTGTQLSYSSTSEQVRAVARSITTFQQIDSTVKTAMALFRFKNVDSLSYTTGVIKGPNANLGDTVDRQHCIFLGYNTNFPSSFSRYFDTDGDGVSDINDPTDLDDDNDGIPDLSEYPSTYPDPLLDADGDGLANYEDPTPGFTVSGITTFWIDTNSDGVNDRYDMDLDGIINSLDLDSDNDGIPDLVEAGGVDTNGDGTVDYTGTFASNDANSNGLIDIYDPAAGGVAMRNLDTDGDGVPNARDLDSDNDGIPDVVEAGGVDANGDGRIDGFTDIDGDGFHDFVDGDLGNDGVAESSAKALILTTTYTAAGNPIPATYIQGLSNTDGRGLPNPYDLDSDDDGIADVTEAGGTDANYDGKIDGFTDTDGDGYSDNVDAAVGIAGTINNASGPLLKTGTDTDSDGRPENYPTRNADGSGPPNPYDLDSDDDGIPDLIESGGVDTDGDGRIGGNTDTNGNGWVDAYDPTLATPGVNIRLLDANGATVGGLVFDFDGDGIPNYLDLDSDNDGIPDILEQGGVDTNNDGKVDVYADIDNDGFADIYDPRNNNTGANPTTLGTALITAATLGTNNIPTTYNAGANFDGTGLINMLDLDADGDGILDVREAGGGITENATTEGIAAGTIQANGWSATVDALATLTLRNTDGTGKPNYLDIDSDDDGIVDNIEGQSTAGYVLPLGVDADVDGIDDAYDNTTTAFAGNGTKDITPVNTDGADVPDYYDLDSDNDGYPDLIEGHDFVGDNKPHANSNTKTGIRGGTTDADGDGLLDGYDNNTASPDATNKAGTTTVTPLNYPNIDNAATTERDWRETYDVDKDGISNLNDIDDDNDGIRDSTECGGYFPLADADGDGIPNYMDGDLGTLNIYGIVSFMDADNDGIINSLDLDSDGDGIPDIIEAGGLDTNGDGTVDYTGVFALFDLNGNGLFDTYDPGATLGVAIRNLDSDNDGIPNTRDLDSDNDGIADVTEAYGTDANYDGLLDSTTDTDGDGLADQVDGDADNNGTTENTAGALIITSATGIAGIPNGYLRNNPDATGLPNPYDLDADDDGIPDLIEAGGVDANGDGRIDITTDANGNGWRDAYDPTNGGINLRTIDANGATAGGLVFDFDGDGFPNYIDLDSDGDGIPDIIEQGGVDVNNNGQADATADVDGDGFVDSYDPINNNTNAALGTPLITTGSVLNAFNYPTTYSAGDNQDGMGLINMLDLDADGDGITDVKEAGFVESGTTPGFASGTLGSTNGWSTTISAGTSALSLPNTDGRGPANYLDIDADDDGITDNVEGQTTTGYIMPSGTDADADGIDDAYDATTTIGGAGIVPANKDGDAQPDYTDLDTDNDGISDLKEGYGDPAFTLTTAQLAADADGDGLLDVFDMFNMAAPTASMLLAMQSNVTMKNITTGGSVPGVLPTLYGSNDRIYKTSVIAGADRDWRNTAIILPVKLITFSAAYSNKVSNISWTTANESAHERFVVERSIDGISFTALTTVAARGNSGSYTYGDNAVPNVNIVYYRLQMVDESGNVSYSKVVAIKLNADKMSLTIYPNPVVDQVAINFASVTAQAVTVKVYNMQGAQVMAQAYKAQAGTNTFMLNNWNNLPAGDYMIEVGNEGFKLTQKLSHVH